MSDNASVPGEATMVTARPEAGASPQARGVGWRCVALAGVLAVAAVLAGCSSDSSTSSTSATTAGSTYPADKQQVCQARDQLQTSVKALADPTLLTQGSSAIKAAVTQVQTDLSSVKSAAKQDYQPQVDALQSAVDDLQTAAGNLGNGNAAENMTAVGDALSNVGSSASALLTQLKTSCD